MRVKDSYQYLVHKALIGLDARVLKRWVQLLLTASGFLMGNINNFHNSPCGMNLYLSLPIL